ncbi:hypothetical protein BKA82DRAFT_4017696 [Pisolithus tinctorius]|nr:hypothetical protein BKA82DRAFT_4017696 [Pisolithus tinctorius]
MSEDFEHPQYWAAGTGQHQYKWTCVACKDNKCSPLQPDVRLPLLELLTDLSDSPSPTFKPTEGANTQCTEVTQEDYNGFQLDWDAIDHDQLYSASAYDRSLMMLASSLATWLAHGDDLQSSDEDGSDTPPAINNDLYEEAWRITSNAMW